MPNPLNWIQRIAIILLLALIDHWLKRIEGGKYQGLAWSCLGEAIDELEATFPWYYNLRYRRAQL